MKRSPREIAFRLRQEAANLRYLAFPPRCPEFAYRSLSTLPDPAAVIAGLQSTAFAREVEQTAESVLAHRIPLLGFCPQFEQAIPWRRDFVSGRDSGLNFFRRIPYLDSAIVGDHKNIWELNRHQHLVVLAQAFRFTGRTQYLDEIVTQVDDWLLSNPFVRGINWTSALEVAFRALSWIWVYHLTGEHWPAGFHRRFVQALYQHACFLAANLSIYSPNTHLLGELVALHAIAVLFPSFLSPASGSGRPAR